MKNVLKATSVAIGLALGGLATYIPMKRKINDLYTIIGLPPDPCEPKPKEMKWLPLDSALRFIHQYEINQASAINSRMTRFVDQNTPPFSDTRSIVFSLATIDSFIGNIEAITKIVKTKTIDGNPIYYSDLGVRFYYAAYTPYSPKHKEKHTLIMVPVYWDRANEVYTEFFPWFVDSSQKAIPLDRYKDDPTGVVGYTPPHELDPALMKANLCCVLFYVDEYGTLHLKNEGSLCPPPQCTETLRKLAENYNQ